MKYYKSRWDYVADEEDNDWGNITWYFEVDDKQKITRQVEIYDKGQRLKYSLLKPEDEYGGIGDEYNQVEFGQNEITKQEFEDVWTR